MRNTIQSARDGASGWANAYYNELKSQYAEQESPASHDENATRGQQYLYLIQKVWMVKDADAKARQFPERSTEIMNVLEQHLSRVRDVNDSPDGEYKSLLSILQAMDRANLAGG